MAKHGFVKHHSGPSKVAIAYLVLRCICHTISKLSSNLSTVLVLEDYA